MPTHHEIKINLKDGSVRPGPCKPLRVGDTVRYTSADGKARVAFPDGSPYEVAELSDSQNHTTQTAGKFTFNCFVTPAGSTEEVGWGLSDPEAGGEHDVKP